MSIEQQELVRLKSDLSGALRLLTSASSQNSTKGRAVQAWFEKNFLREARLAWSMKLNRLITVLRSS